jgi:hypothetical protein
VIATTAESELCLRIQRMLARFEYLLPLAAADFQYRRHYYRLNAAALLEDLFFDALGTHLRQTEPSANFGRAPSGAKGWDYEIGGLKASHKMSKGGTEISVHWDATKKRTSWTAEHPMVVGLSDHLSGTFNVVTPAGVEFRASAVDGNLGVKKKLHSVLVGTWKRHGPTLGFEVMDQFQVEPDIAVVEAVPFDVVWARMAIQLERGGNANDFDMLICPAEKASGLAGLTLRIDGEHLLPGFHVFGIAGMVDLPLKSNNRSGSLLSKELVRRLMRQAQTNGLFAPLPLWFSIYAETRPPNLYSTQRQELDAIFSARIS